MTRPKMEVRIPLWVQTQRPQESFAKMANFSTHSGRSAASRFWAVRVFLEQALVLVVGGSELALDEEILQFGGQLEGVAVGDDYVGELAGFESADLVCQPQNLRGIEGNRFEGIVLREAMGRGIGRVLAETARKRIIKAAKGEFDAGLSELSGLAEQTIVRIVFVRGQREHGPQNDRHVFGAEQLLD